MQLPLQVTFRDMERSEALEADVREKAEKLDRIYDRIMSCRVVIEEHHKHHHQGNLFHCRIDLKVPNGELVASRERGEHHAHEDAYVAIRDAFSSIQRQLERYAEEHRGEVKTHGTPLHGLIAHINLGEGFGMIKSSDGREIYFHRNSVLDAPFQQLKVGTEVRFAEEMGEQGPQASTVHVVGKHHAVG